MLTGKIATVFGGSGFIGRYVVQRLAARGFTVRVAGRNPQSAMFLRPLGRVGQIVPLYAPLSSEADIARAVAEADWVINLVGILVESRRGDFQRIQTEGAGRIAKLTAAAGASRFVQISAIGADASSRSRYATSKAGGEQAVRQAFPGAAILRPSIVFGPEDDFFNQFGKMAMILPFLPLIEGDTKFQPVYAGDVADAVVAALELPSAEGQVFELGGPDIMTFRDILEYILHETRRDRLLLPVPRWLAGIQASVLQNLPGKLLTRDQLDLLRQDNVANTTMPGLAALGVTPTPIRLIVPDYLSRYRAGGRGFQTRPLDKG
jgi:uncharacterized protein YbjT (DUF2867 family)